MTLVEDPRTGELELPITALAVHPSNTRDIGDISGLAASIGELGVLEPLLVESREDDDEAFWVIVGKRRLAAAAAAGLETVPVHFRARDDRRLLAIASENLQRKDLTVAEEAETYLQLEVEGFDVDAVSSATGVSAERIRMGLKAAASPPALAAVQRVPEMTLEQALVIDEFAGDEAIVDQLVNTAVSEPAQFDHTAERLRSTKAITEAFDAKVLEFVDAGVKVLKENTQLGWSAHAKNCRIEHLRTAKGQDVTATAHKKCPGNAVVVSRPYRAGATPTVAYVCTEPWEHGHFDMQGKAAAKPTPAASTKPAPVDAEKIRVAEEEAQQREADWDAATKVRRAHLKTLLGRRTAPKGLLRAVLDQVGIAGVWLGDLTYGLGQELGLDKFPALVKKATEAQLPIILFVAAARGIEEETMSGVNWLLRDTGAEDRKAAASYLESLVATGYTLAPVEELILPKPIKKAAKKPAAKKAPAKKAAAVKKASAKAKAT